MALNRIQFSNDAVGTSPYTLPINPSTLELNDDPDYTDVDVLDGGRILQSPKFDDRPIIMQWEKITSGITGFSTMLSTLRGYQGTIKYVNYRDVDYRVTTSTWDKVRVADLKVKVQPGGSIKYNIELKLIPVQ